MTSKRILHTSDWHLGAVFHGVDRSTDEQHAISAVITLCAQRAIDSVIIAGDVFDTANPGAAEMHRYYDALLRLVREGGVGSVVVIAGNHDSGARLDGPREVLAACQVQVRGVLGLEAGEDEHRIRLVGRDGTPFALCAAIPYLRESDLRMPVGEAPIATRQAQAMQQRCVGLLDLARTAAAGDGLPLVTIAHAFVRGGVHSGSERQVFAEATVGNLGQIDAETLGGGAAYLACGHLHRPQEIAKRPHWRYSGSLLPSGFDELDCGRSVVVATIGGGGPAATEVVALPVHRRYAAVQGTLEEVRSAIDRLPPAVGSEPKPLLMAKVTMTAERHGLYAEVASWAEARGWSALRVLRETAASPHPLAEAPSVDLEDLDPLSVLRFAHRGRHAGNDPTPELEAVFATLLAEVQVQEAT